MVVANPVPFAFWRREVLWRAAGRYGSHPATVLGREGDTAPSRPIGMDDPQVAVRAAGNDRARAFLFWSRMPIARREGEAIVVGDQRFAGSPVGDSFNVRLEP